MAEVKIPSKLHLMSPSFQKKWYKKHGMEMPTASKEKEPEGKSAAAAKRIKVASRKNVNVKPNSVRAINVARQKAYMDKGGRPPIGAMGSDGSNVMAGAGQSTIRDLRASIKAGFNPKVSLDPYQSKRAKKTKNESVDEAAKPDASMAMTNQLKMKMISDKDKRTLGKVAVLMARERALTAQRNKDKKNAYVRGLGLNAMRAGNVDPARGHSPTRFGREVLAKEEVEQIDEKINLVKAKMGDVIKDFQKSDAPQFKGKSAEERRKMALAAKLGAEREAGMREEVEQIDELSPKTAQSYLDKRPHPKVSDIARPDGMTRDQAVNRIISRARAKRIIRVANLKQNPSPPPKSTEVDDNPYGYGQGRYMGDNVNLEGQTMNEVTKKEAEEILGGPVKNKPKGPAGKHPLGYRLARSAARKAMNNMQASMKKEEVEQIDESGETSLKLSQLAKQKATDLERYPSKDGSLGKLRKNPDKQKIRRLRDLANKAYARSRNPTGAPTGNIEGGGHKSLRRQGATDKDIPPNPMNMSKLMGYFKEEVEQVDEAGKGYGPGWMLKHPDGKTLDAKLKAKKELERKRQKSYGDPKAGVSVKSEEVEQVDEVTGYEGVKNRTDIIKRAAAMNRMGKQTFLDRVKTRAAEIRKEKAKKKLANEEVEQIDELKKSTLASYVKRATRDVASASRLQRGYETDAARKGDAANYVARGSDLAAKTMRKFAGKRSRGIAKAVDKLAKEEVEQIEEGKADTSLAAKAQKSGISLGTLKSVFRRGVAAWNSGHRPGTTPSQWGHARVNSYINKGKTYHTADKDLREEKAKGKDPETSTEVELAKKHGDPKKITYGDVIKARIEASKKKALNKGE